MTAKKTLGRIVWEAMGEWVRMKEAGVPYADRLSGMESLLRQVWPFKREWKYLCVTCDDTGLVMTNCPGDTTCGRDKPHGAHTFGTPCWCSLGAKFNKPAPAKPEDFAAAGRTRKMTRLGR